MKIKDGGVRAATLADVRAAYNTYITALRGGGDFTVALRSYERAYVALDAEAREEWDAAVERMWAGAPRAERLDPVGRNARISAAVVAYNEKRRVVS